MGADNKPQEGLLLKKLDVLVSTCSEFPKLSPIQRASFSNLIRQISSTAEKAKNDLVNALQEISDKYAELSVTEDQEPVLTQIIMQYDAALVRAHERINIFYSIIKDRLLNTGIDITPLLDLELFHDASSSIPSQGELSVKGKFTKVSETPGELAWSTNPTLLRE